MEKHTPEFNEGLLRPDPHYIPGYTGYCPQLKYSWGKSYGQLTAELLINPEVKRSNHSVLHMDRLPVAESDSALTQRSIPDSNLKKMIPGYTGFIPRRQNYFGCRYSETCRKALSEFDQEQRSKIQRRSAELPAVVNYTNQQLERPKPPLTAISDKVFVYKPLKSSIPTGKPYLMDDEDSTVTPLPQIYPSNRGVVPSYKGHIPGYKFLYGHTFGQLSQNALEKSGIKRIPPGKPGKS